MVQFTDKTLLCTTDSDEFEAEPTQNSLGVSIRGMSKRYRRGKKLAVDDLCLNFYEDQVNDSTSTR